MSLNFYQSIKERRTNYTLSNVSTISDNKIKEIVKDAVKESPSAFNSQSSRVVVLTKDKHDKLWEITKNILKNIVPEEAFAQTEEKINSFKAGYGTVFIFEDQSVIEYLQENYSLYKDNFPIWSQQSTGMLQYVIWTALCVEGMGASLQHYSELIEDQVKKEWNLPDTWKLIAQMPFGKALNPPAPRETNNLEDRVLFF